MIIKIGDKEFNFDGYANINEIAKAFDEAQNKAYQQGRAKAIDECKALFRKYILTKEIEGLDKLFDELKEQIK